MKLLTKILKTLSILLPVIGCSINQIKDIWKDK